MVSWLSHFKQGLMPQCFGFARWQQFHYRYKPPPMHRGSALKITGAWVACLLGSGSPFFHVALSRD
jgi:hypothetical protein